MVVWKCSQDSSDCLGRRREQWLPMPFQIENSSFYESSHLEGFGPSQLQFALLPVPRRLEFAVPHSFSTFLPFDVDFGTRPMMRCRDCSVANLDTTRIDRKNLRKFLTSVAIGFSILIKCILENCSLLPRDPSATTGLGIALTSNEDVLRCVRKLIERDRDFIGINGHRVGRLVSHCIGRYELHGSNT